MADKLTYKGGKDVVNSVGTMKLVLPKGGGDFHRVPKWWGKKGTVGYVEAAIFKVPLDDGSTVRLILPGVKAHMTVEIRHDGNAEFVFPNSGNLERAAVVPADNFNLIVEYQFAKISGGSVLKRTVGNLPNQPVQFSGQSTITGNATVGNTITYTAAEFTGGLGAVSTNLILQVSDSGTGGWAFKAGNPGIASGGAATYAIQPGDETKFFRASFQVTDDNGVQSQNSTAIGPVITTFSEDAALADYTYTVGVNNIGTAELPQNVYTLNGVDAPDLYINTDEVVLFDFTAVAAEHPLAIFTDSTKATPYTTGVAVEGSKLLLRATETTNLSYQCINHANMGGDIYIS